jgi:DNA-binding transcriptional regulator YiaG
MASGKIEQAKKLREQADQLLAEAKEEEQKRINALREELKKAENDFNKTYGITTRAKRARKVKVPRQVKASSNPLMDEEIIRIYENGLKQGTTDIKMLKAFLDPQLKRRSTILNKVVEAWGNADREAKSKSENFVAFFKSL